MESIRGLTHPDGVMAHIRAITPSLSDATGRVARLVLADPAAASRSTIVELARRAETSEGTVTRAVRALGFDGYSDFRLTLAHSLGGRGDAAVVTGDVHPSDSIDVLVAKVAAEEEQTIRETAAHLDYAALSQTAAAIARARRVSLYGAASSGLAAQDLHIKLSRIGINSHATADPHIALADAALLTKDDVVVVASHSGTSMDATQIVDAAATGGAVTVAITGHTGTPLAARADHILIASGAEDSFRSGRLSSRIGDIFTAHCLFICVAQLTLDQASTALEASYTVLSQRLTAPPKPPRR